MDKQKNTPRDAAPSSSLREAISEARLEEAQEIDGTIDLRGSELARLEILKNALQKVFDEVPSREDRFELVLMPSTPARLWIDMLSYVEMDADCEVYRFVRNERSGRHVAVESRDAGVLKGRITEYMARQIVARERQLSGLVDMPPERRQRRRMRPGLVFLSFLIGILTGAAGLLALGWAITQ